MRVARRLAPIKASESATHPSLPILAFCARTRNERHASTRAW